MVKKWFYILPIALVLIGTAIVSGVFSGGSSGKKETAAQEQLPSVACHSFPDKENEIAIPIGPNRWEGVILPSDATAYRIEPSTWHQIKTWAGKQGPVVKKSQGVVIPIPRNRNISQATFWVRGEGEVKISIERG